MPVRRLDFRSADFERLAALWNKFYPERYRIDAELLKLNTIDSPLFDWGASSIICEEDTPIGFVAIKKSAARLFKGPDPDQSHVNSLAFSEPTVAVDLLADVKKVLRNRGATKLIFGQDSRHFFPGCPTECRELTNFCLVEGFVSGPEVSDLERDLEGYANPAADTVGGEFRMLEEEDHPSLVNFLTETFPGRWKHDALDKAAQEGIGACIYGLLIGGNVEGFALIQKGDVVRPVGGAVWKADLGRSWGSLGPIGVSEKVRGKGYGNALLGKGLDHLKASGVRRCIIDWTGLLDFYRKHGFEVARTYETLTLSLDSA